MQFFRIQNLGKCHVFHLPTLFLQTHYVHLQFSMRISWDIFPSFIEFHNLHSFHPCVRWSRIKPSLIYPVVYLPLYDKVWQNHLWDQKSEWSFIASYIFDEHLDTSHLRIREKNSFWSINLALLYVESNCSYRGVGFLKYLQYLWVTISSNGSQKNWAFRRLCLCRCSSIRVT